MGGTKKLILVCEEYAITGTGRRPCRLEGWSGERNQLNLWPMVRDDLRESANPSP